jgi:hypothetical protein
VKESSSSQTIASKETFEMTPTAEGEKVFSKEGEAQKADSNLKAGQTESSLPDETATTTARDRATTADETGVADSSKDIVAADSVHETPAKLIGPIAKKNLRSFLSGQSSSVESIVDFASKKVADDGSPSKQTESSDESTPKKSGVRLARWALLKQSVSSFDSTTDETPQSKDSPSKWGKVRKHRDSGYV